MFYSIQECKNEAKSPLQVPNILRNGVEQNACPVKYLFYGTSLLGAITIFFQVLQLSDRLYIHA